MLYEILHVIINCSMFISELPKNHLTILAEETDNPHVNIDHIDLYWQWAQQSKGLYALQFLFNIIPSKSFKS